MELRTRRLRLRHWRPDDRDAFATLNADPEVMAYFPAALSREESDALADRIEAAMTEQGWGLWAVEIVDGVPFAGFVGLIRQTFAAPFTPCVEIGWRLARPYWGHGYATEAARAALAYGFGMAGLPEIVSMTAVGNVRSRRVMERLGMTRDAADDFDHPRIPAGHPLARQVLYRLSNSAGRDA